MRIAVVGTGGIGGPYGASLAAAGADVTFVARGAHLAAIRENGLRVEGDRGETHIRPAQATDDIASIGPVDFVLFCIKLWDVEEVGAQLRPILGPETALVPLQNGVDAAERLIPILGPEAVMGGTAFVTGNIAAPGVIRQTGTYQRMTFGELDGRMSERGQRLRQICEAAGFEGVLSSALVGFGSPSGVAILGVLGWRLVNFWLPIPVGALAYLSLRVEPGAPAERKAAELEQLARQSAEEAEDRRTWAARLGLRPPSS